MKHEAAISNADSKAYVETLEEIGEELAEDRIDSVLQACEGISERLRAALGAQPGDRCVSCLSVLGIPQQPRWG